MERLDWRRKLVNEKFWVLITTLIMSLLMHVELMNIFILKVFGVIALVHLFLSRR
jgi:hypothetical protein